MNYLGVDYYPEQWDSNLIEADLENIVELGANVIRIGEFAWHLMEKTEGNYDFSFFDNIIKKAREKGLKIIFGTPTATMPAWVNKNYPECVSEFEDGTKRSFGGRRTYCFNSSKYIELTKKITKALAHHYKDEVAIVAWQMDNEFGHEDSDVCYCNNCKTEFRKFLEAKYETIQNLNEIWGTIFWSQTYNNFNEIPIPQKTVAAHNPALKLDWERFRSASVEKYGKMQYDILKEILPKDKILLHDFAGGVFEKSINYSKVAEYMDVVAYNNYPVWGGQANPIPPYKIACYLDCMRGLKRQNFWITEAIMGAQGHDAIGYLPRPNEAKMWSYQAVAHGCSSLIYFRYRQATKGAEQFCYGVIDSDNEKRRKFYEVKDFFKHMNENPEIMESEVSADVALIYDYDSLASFRGQRQSGAFDNGTEICRLYKPFYKRNVSIDVISADKDFSKYKVVLVPAMTIYKEDVFNRLKQFAKSGKTVLMSFRSALKDEFNNLVLGQKLPLYSTDFIGGYVEEAEPLNTGQQALLKSSLEYSKEGGTSGTGTVFRDIVKTTTAKTLMHYDDSFFSEFSAVTVNNFEDGKVYYIGTGLDDENMLLIADRIIKDSQIETTITENGVEVCKKVVNGKTISFVINHNACNVNFEGKDLKPFEAIVKLPNQ